MKDALGSVQSVLVLGGGSDIALATLRELVAAAGPHGRARGARPRRRSRPRAAELRALGRDDGRDGRLRRPRHRVSTTAFVDDVFEPRRRHRPRAPRVRRARRPGGGRARRPRRGRHRRGRTTSGSVSVGGAARAAHARAGPRHDRGAVVGRRRAGPAVELRLRLVEGGHGRVLPGPRRQPRRHRRAGHDRAARVRAHEDDRRAWTPAPLSTTPEAVADAIVHGLGARQRDRLGAVARSAT